MILLCVWRSFHGIFYYVRGQTAEEDQELWHQKPHVLARLYHYLPMHTLSLLLQLQSQGWGIMNPWVPSSSQKLLVKALLEYVAVTNEPQELSDFTQRKFLSLSHKVTFWTSESLFPQCLREQALSIW